MEIGSPALSAVFNERMKEGRLGDQELRLLAWVIYLIDGKDLGLARLNLRARRWAEPPTRSRARTPFDSWKCTRASTSATADNGRDRRGKGKRGHSTFRKN